MPAPSILTNDEQQWAMRHVKLFSNCQAEKSLPTKFWPFVYGEYFKKFGLRPPTKLEIEAKKILKAKTCTEEAAKLAQASIKAKRELQIKTWFTNYNRCQGAISVTTTSASATSRNAKTQTLDVTLKKPPQAWQAYWKLREGTLWPQLKKAWGAVTDEQVKKSGKLVFMCKWVNKLLEKESPEVLKEVETHRIALTGWAPAGESKSQQNARVNGAVVKLLQTMQEVADALYFQTGWTITIIAGGPLPEQDGKLKMYLSASGPSKGEESLQDRLGPEYETSISNTFSQGLRALYGDEDARKKELSLHKREDCDSPESEEDAGNASDGSIQFLRSSKELKKTNVSENDSVSKSVSIVKKEKRVSEPHSDTADPLTTTSTTTSSTSLASSTTGANSIPQHPSSSETQSIPKTDSKSSAKAPAPPVDDASSSSAEVNKEQAKNEEIVEQEDDSDDTEETTKKDAICRDCERGRP
ncbi:hypothetical protein FA15DRAFT_661656 [Coprinopsis marcescibilis]|uniref:Uncharacterized protein n=1 Tax=Coprinopsis marcescibilis TaxID=230819 RepID=A0A5C3KA32_COPMA|nr:hypothetical protein FA15DRAFT_661805 [Coprinopsis marcescibilis]TFK17158.1 hypothetical protein FA15DRAFT_661656 [Coprinopsis marcescibilis]